MTQDEYFRLPSMEAFGRELERIADREITRGRYPLRTRVGVSVAALLGLIAAFATTTTPGQALAERVGELIGIGDEPSRQVRNPIDEPAVVIGSGQTPSGDPYEIVASGDTNLQRDEHPLTCISLDLPDAAGPGKSLPGTCISDRLQRSLANPSFDALTLLRPTGSGALHLVVQGIASPEIASAEIEHRSSSGSVERFPVQVAHLEGELRRTIGANADAAYFAAFLPEDLVPPPNQTTSSSPDPRQVLEELMDHPANQALSRLRVIGFDRQGQEIARTSLNTGPFAVAILYSYAPSPPDGSLRLAAPPGDISGVLGAGDPYETCFEEVLPRYGEPGKIEPQLPERFFDEVRACVERQR